ncbi:hypothetical protein [Deinococcus sonorensis]|uniref:Lipoprotein n=2 Tax=Deinococcus sonorensis TaxID=309891 RepID=A0AAU7U8S6_9DEIO
MNKILALSALSVALSACTLVGNPLSKDVSGQLRGFPSGQDLRLAIVGYSNGRYTADGSESQIVDKYLTGGFTLDLPKTLGTGTYRVVVYTDVNRDGRFSTGDRVVSRDNGKLLVNAQRSGQFYPGIKAGWNIYNTATRESSSLALTNYDLDYAGQ